MPLFISLPAPVHPFPSSSTTVCLCCSLVSFDTRSRRVLSNTARAKPPPSDTTVLVCTHCGGTQYRQCALDFVETLRSDRRIPSRVVESDDWCNDVLRLADSAAGPDGTIPIAQCIGCEFKRTVTTKKPSFSLPHPSKTSIARVDASGKSEPTTKRKAALAMDRKRARHVQTESQDTAAFLIQYFGFTEKLQPRFYEPKTKAVQNNLKGETGKFDLEPPNLPLSGAVHLPMWGTSLVCRGRNYRPHADHHHFADCKEPAALHGIVSQRSAEEVEQYCQAQDPPHKIPYFPKEFVESMDLVVHAPEDPRRSRKFVVAVGSVGQEKTAMQVSSRNAKPANDVYELAHSYLFSSSAATLSPDVLILLGRWEKEPLPHPPEKLLLLRLCGMLSNMTNEQATEFLSMLRVLCGRHGFEFNRSCGSSGLPSDQSDCDLLTALKECSSALPRKAGAAKITRGETAYYITYRRTMKDKDGKLTERTCTVQYFPPKIGGPFFMEMGLLEKNSLACEVTYVKAVAVNIIKALNEKRSKRGLPPVARCQVEAEELNIKVASEHYLDSGSFLEFCAVYNLFNKHSLVTHSSAYHNDHFKTPSLENKVLLVDYERDGYQGRGGSQLGNYYCYALLDWGHLHRLEKAWFIAYGRNYNIDPNSRLTPKLKASLPASGQALLDEYLASAVPPRPGAAAEVHQAEL